MAESFESSAKIISGTQIAAQVTEELSQQVKELVAKFGLAVILVGARPDSATYVRNKKRACEKAGILSNSYEFAAETTEAEILDLLSRLNDDASVHGILVQLPLPDHMNQNTIIAAISPQKDVDGLHVHNAGSLFQFGPAKTPLVSCTPLGCIELIRRSGYDIAGKHAVVLGRSNIVGKPVAQLLMAHNATVTVCHSKTLDLPSFTRQADILIVAIGHAELVKGDWIKPGAVVIDVGIDAVPDQSAKGYHLVGDVDFASARLVAGALTPVPGGVGPMTIAMLLRNTVTAFVHSRP